MSKYSNDHSSITRPSAADAKVLAKLRAGTASQHLQLETELDLLRADLTVGEYKDLLVRFYGFYHPWECRSQPLLSEMAPRLYENRSKTNLLRSDLCAFGTDPERVPLCESLPPLSTFSQVLGSTYVLEGATLGGQILSRHFTHNIGIPASRMSFFSGYGERTGCMWKSFCEEFTQLAANGDEGTIITSAQTTFQTLREWLLNGETE